jgi:hypothetical protein
LKSYRLALCIIRAMVAAFFEVAGMTHTLSNHTHFYYRYHCFTKARLGYRSCYVEWWWKEEFCKRPDESTCRRWRYEPIKRS